MCPPGRRSTARDQWAFCGASRTRGGSSQLAVEALVEILEHTDVSERDLTRAVLRVLRRDRAHDLRPSDSETGAGARAPTGARVREAECGRRARRRPRPFAFCMKDFRMLASFSPPDVRTPVENARATSAPDAGRLPCRTAPAWVPAAFVRSRMEGAAISIHGNRHTSCRD